MAEVFEFKSGTEVFRTGMKTPTSYPLAFAEYPENELYDEAELKAIFDNPKRKLMLEVYPDVWSQGRVSSCCPFATSMIHAMKWFMTFGKKLVFEPCSIYSRICGGVDQGALLEDALKEIVRGGVCLKGSWAEYDWSGRSMNMEQKRHAMQEALDHRALDVYRLGRDPDTAWRALLSALARRDFVNGAIHCDDAFFQCPADGMLRPARGNGNHSVALIDAKQFGRGIRDYKILAKNSHGSRWAMKGHCWAGFDSFARTFPIHAFFAERNCRLHPDDPIRTLLAA